MVLRFLFTYFIASHVFCAQEDTPTDYELLQKEVLHASFSEESFMGRGTYGEVFVVQLSSGLKIAVKRSSGSDYSSSYNEALILRNLQHYNIIKFEYFFTFSSNCYLCLALMDCDLDFLLNRERELGKNKRQFSQDHIVLAMLHILDGLDYLKSQRVVHGDIKPLNILLNGEPLRCVIADFGDSVCLKEGIESIPIEEDKILPTTLWYRSWEILNRDERGYSYPCDIWASGCVFWEILFLSPLFPGSYCPIERIDNLREQLAKDSLSNNNQIEMVKTTLPKIDPSKFSKEWQRK